MYVNENNNKHDLSYIFDKIIENNVNETIAHEMTEILIDQLKREISKSVKEELLLARDRMDRAMEKKDRQ